MCVNIFKISGQVRNLKFYKHNNPGLKKRMFNTSSPWLQQQEQGDLKTHDLSIWSAVSDAEA